MSRPGGTDAMHGARIRLLAALLALLSLAGCATTSIRSAWFDANFKGGPFKRILVVDLIVGQLAARGLIPGAAK